MTNEVMNKLVAILITMKAVPEGYSTSFFIGEYKRILEALNEEDNS